VIGLAEDAANEAVLKFHWAAPVTASSA
jgi:hypothetical protein